MPQQNQDQRPQVSALVSALLQAMESGQEVYIANLKAVVPHCFRIHMHHEAYDQMRPHFTHFKVIAMQELDKRLEALKKQGIGDFWAKIWRLIRGVVLKQPLPKLEISTLGRWEIEVIQAFDLDLPMGYLRVEAGFSSIGKPSSLSESVFMGAQTKGLSFMVQGDQALKTAPLAGGMAATSPSPQTEEDVFATLSWMNPATQSEQQFHIKTPYLAIGREGASDAEYAHLPVLRLSGVPAEISRVHGYFQYKATEGTFRFKNLGLHGTTILPPARETEDGWAILAPNCRLCLGNKLFVDFAQR
ncbi:MAG: hypothetical protein J0L94_08355 [Rhodothermia bacterium]|nr:hypothetical protein [Rhodothermia bacterium]